MIGENYIGYRDTEYLIKKYQTKQPGECNANTSEVMKRRRQNERLRYVDYVAKHLKLNKNQEEQVRELILAAPQFKNICRRCTWQCIVTAMAWHIKFLDKKEMGIMRRYKICRENDLTIEKYGVIMSHLLQHFMKKVPLGMVIDNYKIGYTI